MTLFIVLYFICKADNAVSHLLTHIVEQSTIPGKNLFQHYHKENEENCLLFMAVRSPKRL